MFQLNFHKICIRAINILYRVKAIWKCIPCTIDKIYRLFSNSINITTIVVIIVTKFQNVSCDTYNMDIQVFYGKRWNSFTSQRTICRFTMQRVKRTNIDSSVNSTGARGERFALVLLLVRSLRCNLDTIENWSSYESYGIISWPSRYAAFHSPLEQSLSTYGFFIRL